MRYVAWDVEMSTPNDQGSTPRQATRSLVKRGRSDLRALLDGPPFPAALSYLLEWMVELRRGLGRDMEGIAPLTWVTLDAWTRHADVAPAPHEVQALFLLDRVMRDPKPFHWEPA